MSPDALRHTSASDFLREHVEEAVGEIRENIRVRVFVHRHNGMGGLYERYFNVETEGRKEKVTEAAQDGTERNRTELVHGR